MNREIKKCQNCQQDFAIEPEDFLFYEKISSRTKENFGAGQEVPPPTFCPECRLVRRVSFENQRSLYKRKCDLCRKEIISVYDERVASPVYCQECWNSDQWNPQTYGREYQWNTDFFTQFKELQNKVPRLALFQYHTNINSEYSNYISNDRDVYFSFSVVDSEKVSYGNNVDNCKECLDCLFLKKSELCYENIDGDSNYRCVFLSRSHNCLDSSFLFDCANCQYCFLSSNLRNKQYVFCNRQLTKEEYFKKIKEINFGSFGLLNKLKQENRELISHSLHKFANLIKTENCSGDNIWNAKNVRDAFGIHDAENVRYFVRGYNLKDSYDVHGSSGKELAYECLVTGWNSSRLLFSSNSDASYEIQYCDWCHSSSNLFGCIGLRAKKYCILNKQYTKEEYEELIPKIIEHMNSMPYVDKNGRVYKYGEFFPAELSPFSYNETVAQEYFPLTKEESLAKGYSWKEPEEKNYQITMKTEDIPDHIKDVPDSIVNEIIQCGHTELQLGNAVSKCNEQCATAFKIIEPELQFYRRMNLPLPRLCPNCRHYQRLKQRNPLKLWQRKCMCGGETSDKGVYKNTAEHFHKSDHCPNEFETTYSPERKEIVYCESCYNNEVV